MPQGDWHVQGGFFQIPFGVYPSWIVATGTEIPAALVSYYAAEPATIVMAQMYALSPTNYVYYGLIVDASSDVWNVIGAQDGGVVQETYRINDAGLQIYGVRGGPSLVTLADALMFVRGSSEIRILNDGISDLGALDAYGDGGSGVIRRNGSAARWLTFMQQNRSTGASLNLTLAQQALPGTLINVNVLGNNAQYRVTATFAFSWTAAGATTAEGFMRVDGVNAPGLAFFESPATTTPFATVYQEWVGTLAAGAHTFELYADKNINAGTVQAAATQCQITVQIFE